MQDMSADIIELGRTPVAVVCAGIKTILDVPRTLEALETHGVPTYSLGTSQFPGFFTADSGCPSPAVAHSVHEVARAIQAADTLGMQSGMLIAVPNPAPAADIEEAIQVCMTMCVYTRIHICICISV